MASKLRSKAPVLWVVAGPNGSGKSSLYSDIGAEAFDRSVWIINPDLLTERIQLVEGLSIREANIEAVVRVEAWLEASIRAYQTIGVETVLSTDKYWRLVLIAKQQQFEFRLTYIILQSPDLNVERVRLRVKKGGQRRRVKDQGALGQVSSVVPRSGGLGGDLRQFGREAAAGCI